MKTKCKSCLKDKELLNNVHCLDCFLYISENYIFSNGKNTCEAKNCINTDTSDYYYNPWDGEKFKYCFDHASEFGFCWWCHFPIYDFSNKVEDMHDDCVDDANYEMGVYDDNDYDYDGYYDLDYP